MKKPVAFLMACLALAASLSCAFAEVETNHILWDIPWGVSHEDFCTQALQKTGIVFTYDEDESQQKYSYCEADPQAQDITILGQKVAVLFSRFDGKEGYSRTKIFYHYAARPVPLHDALLQLEALYLQLQALYGFPTYHVISVTPAEAKTGENYSVPFLEHSIDLSRIENILQENTHSLVEVFFNNVHLELNCFSSKENPDTKLCSLILTFHKNVYPIAQEAMDAGTVHPSYDDRFATPSPSPTATPSPTPLPAVDVGL